MLQGAPWVKVQSSGVPGDCEVGWGAPRMSASRARSREGLKVGRASSLNRDRDGAEPSTRLGTASQVTVHQVWKSMEDLLETYSKAPDVKTIWC